MPNCRTWIARSFWAGAVLTFVGLLACAVTLVLIAVGDQAGTQGVWGVFLVAAVAWVINFVALVAMLAWRVISEDDSSASGSESQSTSGPSAPSSRGV
jgi:uncharacterized membrane protein